MKPSSQNHALPHWSMDAIYPGLESQAFEQGLARLSATLDEVIEYFDQAGIMLRESPPPVNAQTVATFESAIQQLNQVATDMRLHYAYISSFIATNSRNAKAQARMSEIMQHTMALKKLMTRFTAWIGSLDVDSLLAASPRAREHTFALNKARVEAEHMMAPEEEALALELDLTGGSAWVKFYSNFTSQITATVEVEGELQTLPMTAIRNLAFDPNPETRRRAYEVELDAWEANAMPIATALNCVKGQMNTLNARRGWETALEMALFNNHIDRHILDTMMDTARAHFPVFRRYLRAKAGLLGKARLAWYDLFAPVGTTEQRWSFARARERIVQEFAAFAPRLGSLAERAFREHWIDAEPRDGKRGGAFCMWVREGESRILCNYQPAYAGMSTLAHELGHAYHNLERAGRTYIQRQTPMTLAETASNFCEILMRDAVMDSAPPQEKLVILEASLQDATQVVVDITSRFLFEQAVFERRQKRELSADEFKDIMVESQIATYGEGLDEQYLHPYMWAVKPHYYGMAFYNFPYMFGLLFSLGLYAHYKNEPNRFLENYADLLSATGMHDAATLAERFGFDLRQPAFWEASLSLIAEDVDRFERLAQEGHEH